MISGKRFYAYMHNCTFIVLRCGYATVHDVLDKSLEDRQESFFLSETVKYLYLLFDFSNPINVNDMSYVFSTEGHILPLTGIIY